MARKMSVEEHETFIQLLKEAELSAIQNLGGFVVSPAETRCADLEPPSEPGIWYCDDISRLPTI